MPAAEPLPSLPMLPSLGHVRARRQETPDVVTLDIEPSDKSLLGVQPGQFNMLAVLGVGEVPISLSAVDAERGLLVHTIRAVGPVSAALAALEPGAVLGLRGPFGVGWPMAALEGRDVVVLAGGLGLVPLRPALQALVAHRERFGRLALLVGARTPGDLLWSDELAAWARDAGMLVEVTVDRAGVDWHGHVGVVTTLLPGLHFDLANAAALVCGPEPMMRAGALALASAGMAEADIHLSLERNMHCATGLCGHCQCGPFLVCRDGPVLPFSQLRALMLRKEL